METNNLIEELRSLIQEATMGVDLTSVDSELSLREAGVDSLDLSAIGLAIEEHYGVQLSDDDLGNSLSLSSLAARISSTRGVE